MTQFFVKNRENLTDRIVAFTLMPKAPFTSEPWSAGAHIDIDLGPLGSRSYSLITWPNENSANYQIAVQREDQGLGGSQAVHAFKTGQSVIVSPPKNSFALIDDDLPVALIAGGIGITPMISMATALHKEGRLFILHYLGRSAETIACSDRLRAEFGDAVNVHLDDRNPIDLSSTVEASGQKASLMQLSLSIDEPFSQTAKLLPLKSINRTKKLKYKHRIFILTYGHPSTFSVNTIR